MRRGGPFRGSDREVTTLTHEKRRRAALDLGSGTYPSCILVSDSR